MLMKYIVPLITLMISSLSFARECGNIEVFQVQKKLNEAFIDTYKSEYAYAHIHCRNQQCYRAYDLTVIDTGRDSATGRAERTLTTIKCTSDRSASWWETVTSPITSSFLNTYFENMKGKPPEHGGLPLITVTPSNNQSTQPDADESATSAID